MKKKIVSMLLLLVMVLAIIPLTTLAAERVEGIPQVRVIVANTTLSVEEGAAWEGTLVDTWVDLTGSPTAMECIIMALAEVNCYPGGAENNYIYDINGLSAGTVNGMDGWMILLNDWFINEGAGAFTEESGTLTDGDEICVMYSLDMGEDLGGTWYNNDKSVKNVTFSVGELDQEFNSQVFEYALYVPAGTTGVVVTPTATNKNFQVRTSDVAGVEYKRTASVPVFDNSIIYVTCGDPNWPTMNGGEWGNGAENVPAVQYIFHVVEVTPNTAPVLSGGASAAADAVVGEAYTLDLNQVFTDADGDVLTYTVSVNGAAAVTANAQYSYTPTAVGTTTLVFTASDGTDSGPSYTVTLDVEAAKADLRSLIVHTGFSPNAASVLLKNPEDAYDTTLVFDPETLTYTLAVSLDTTAQLRFRPAVSHEGDTVILHYGEETKDITWSSGSSKWANCLTAGRNELKLEVVPAEGSGRESVTYTLVMDCLPTLTSLNAEADNSNVYWDTKFAAATNAYTLTIPADTASVTLNAAPKYEAVTVTYNGSESNVVDVANTGKIEVILTAGEVTNTYTLDLNKVATNTVSFRTTPADAIVKVYDSEGNAIAPNADGSYTGMYSAMDYTYTVTRYGYVAQTGTVPGTNCIILADLEKAADSTLSDVDAYWPSFRGNDWNMAITDVLLPIDPANTSLKWNKALGSGWSNAPSVQIIVDDSLIVMCNTGIYKLDLQTGEVLAQGTMAAAPSYGYTPPIYAEGMIFCPLGSGTVQAFDAKNLESVWIYQDSLGGQSLSPITYSDGYIYTGFWNGETKNANYVCLSVTDEDPTKTDEAKTATWKHTQLGGFYWAGSVAVGDALIVGTDDGASGTSGSSQVYSFNKYTGEVVSCLELAGAGDQRSTMSYDAASGRIYFTTKGGYLCRVDVSTETGAISDLKTFNNQAQSTSTPIVYKGKVYYGTGSGISSTGSSGNVVVADAETLEMLYAVGLQGYPQCSLLMTTGYEASTGYIYLYATYNNTPGGISMIKVDPGASTAEGTELIELYDAAGFSQYCIASPLCGPDGTIYYKNDSGNILAVSAPQESAVITLIDAIGEVTLDREAAIEAARTAYDALSEDQQALVTNYNVLTAAEGTLALLQKAVADQAAADAVTAAIAAIGEVTLDDEAAITAARAAYNALTEDQQALVTNAADLTAAENTLAQLKAEADEDETQPTTPSAPSEGEEEETKPTDPSNPSEDEEEETKPTDPSNPSEGEEEETKPTDPSEDDTEDSDPPVEEEKTPGIIGGADNTWTSGNASGVTVTIDGNFNTLTELKVNGKAVSPEHYTISEDGTSLTLSASFLATLTEGKYTVTCQFAGGEVTATVTVAAPETDPNPDTGDTTVLPLMLALLAISMLGLPAVTVSKKKF